MGSGSVSPQSRFPCLRAHHENTLYLGTMGSPPHPPYALLLAALTVLASCTKGAPPIERSPIGVAEEVAPDAALEALEADGGSADDGEFFLDAYTGCTKVDFLFVVDNSGSMSSVQSQLAAAFPDFIESILRDVPGTDHHIMVVDSDGCEDESLHDCETLPGSRYCPAYRWTACTPTQLSTCDNVLGAGFTAGPLGFNCDFPDGRRYLKATDDRLVERFICAATTGTAGSSEELPMSAMVKALSPELAQPGGCSDGFLREDALLVVTILSDDPETVDIDDALVGDPTLWYDAVVGAKNDPSEVVVIGIIPNGSRCQTTDRFVQFVELFGDQGQIGEVCSGDYTPTFTRAVTAISQACGEFSPIN